MPETPWLTVAEVAAVARCGARLVYREITAGRLRAARVGGRKALRIRRDWVDAWLEACATPIEVGRA